jgi:hypothetical protein
MLAEAYAWLAAAMDMAPVTVATMAVVMVVASRRDGIALDRLYALRVTIIMPTRAIVALSAIECRSRETESYVAITCSAAATATTSPTKESCEATPIGQSSLRLLCIKT